jgi:hypothetical protein
MFMNATLLEMYARARRDEDLLPKRSRPSVHRGAGPRALLRKLLGRPAPSPAASPVPVAVHPR